MTADCSLWLYIPSYGECRHCWSWTSRTMKTYFSSKVIFLIPENELSNSVKVSLVFKFLYFISLLFFYEKYRVPEVPWSVDPIWNLIAPCENHIYELRIRKWVGKAILTNCLLTWCLQWIWSDVIFHSASSDRSKFHCIGKKTKMSGC